MCYNKIPPQYILLTGYWTTTERGLTIEKEHMHIQKSFRVPQFENHRPAQ